MNKRFGALVFALSVALSGAAFAQTLPSAPSEPFHLDLYETLRLLEAGVSAPDIARSSIAEESPFNPELLLDPHESETSALIAADIAGAGVRSQSLIGISSFDPGLSLDREALALIAADPAPSSGPSIPLLVLTDAEFSSGSAEVELAVAAHAEALVLAEVFGLADPGPAEFGVASSTPILSTAERSSGTADVELTGTTRSGALALAQVFGQTDPGPAEIMAPSLYNELWADTTGSVWSQSDAASATQVDRTELTDPAPYDRPERPTDALEVY